MPITISAIYRVRKFKFLLTDRRLSSCNPKLAVGNLGKELTQRVKPRSLVHKASTVNNHTCTLIDKAAKILVFKRIEYHREDPLNWRFSYALRKCKFAMLRCSGDLFSSSVGVWFKLLDWSHSIGWPKKLNQGQVRVLDCYLVTASLELIVRFLKTL